MGPFHEKDVGLIEDLGCNMDYLNPHIITVLCVVMLRY